MTLLLAGLLVFPLPGRDLYGDPLPPGALARCGSIRWAHPPHGFFICAIAPDGRVVATATLGGAQIVRLWDAATARLLRTLEPSEGRIDALAFAPDGRTLAASFNEADTCGLVLWDLDTGRLARHWQRPTAKGQWETVLLQVTGFAPDGRTVIAWDGGGWLFWDSAAGPPGRKFPEVQAVVGSGPWHLVTVRPGYLRWWDLQTGRHGSLARRHRPRRGKGKEQTTAVAVGPAPLLELAGWGYDKFSCLDLRTGRVQRLAPGLGRDVEEAALSPDGRSVLVIRDGDQPTYRSLAQLVDRATGRELWRVAGLKWFSPCFAPDGRTVYLADWRQLRAFDVATGRERVPLVRHGRKVEDLAFAPDGKTVAAVDGGPAVWRWEATTGRRLGIWPLPENARPSRCAFTPDGRRLVVAAGGSRWVGILEAATGRVESAWDTPEAQGQLADLAVAPDGQTVAVTLDSGRIELRAVATGQLVRALTAAGGSVYAVAWAADGRRLAVGVDATFNAWDLTRPGLAAPDVVPFTWPRREISCVDPREWQFRLAFTPDGQSLLVLAGPHPPRRIDLATGTAAPLADPPDQKFSTLTASPNGRLTALGNYDGGVELCEVATGRRRAAFTGHVGTVTALAFAPDGQRLASGGADGNILIWDVTGRHLLDRPPTPTDLERHWAALAGADAAAAHHSLAALRALGDPAVAFLGERVPPVAPIPAATLAGWVADLGDGAFAVRERATAQLAAAGARAVPALEAARGAGPEERRRRAGELLRQATVPRLRPLRAVEAVEAIGTPAARALLERWAAGAAGADLTAEAARALVRWRRRGP